jgi:GNAT superfamily N-acetyltransferase
MTRRTRLATAADLPALGPIEVAAAALFPDDVLPADVRDAKLPPATLARAQQEGRLWVAVDNDDAPVGFALARLFPPGAYLDEMDVHPAHQRQGHGRALLQTVAAWASTQGAAALWLLTFAQVPWNAPYYLRCGFEIVPDELLPQPLPEWLRSDVARGLRGRVAMRQATSAGAPLRDAPR